MVECFQQLEDALLTYKGATVAFQHLVYPTTLSNLHYTTSNQFVYFTLPYGK